MEGFTYIWYAYVCQTRKSCTCCCHEFAENSVNCIDIRRDVVGHETLIFRFGLAKASNDSEKDGESQGENVIGKRKSDCEGNSRDCDIKTCRVTRGNRTYFASPLFFIAWAPREFSSALDFRLRNTAKLTILDSARGERKAGRNTRSELPEGNFVVPFIYSGIPSYLRESHVPFLGYLLSRGIADVETIRETRNCVKHDDDEVGMCGHRASSGFDKFADVLN